jgi:myo-inositol-hexaphosphate 3-phosphohydrolase
MTGHLGTRLWKYEAHDERGERRKVVARIEVPPDTPLTKLIKQHAIADHLAIYRRTPRGGYVLVRKGKPP